MKRLAFFVGVPLWLLLVFVVVFRLTFPSQAIADRAQLAISDATNGSMLLEMESVSPRWVGLSGYELLLSSVDDAQVATPILIVEDVTVRTGLIGLLTRSPKVRGNASFGDGRIDFTGRIAADDDGRFDLRALDVEATALPLSALPPVQGTKLLTTGGLDLNIDLDTPDGYATSYGRATLSGANIELTGLSGDMGALVEGFNLLPATISRLDLVLDVNEGTATVTRGTLMSTLADVEITGEIVLANRLQNSRLRLDLVIDTKEALSGVSSMMRQALWESDDKYHYELGGTFGNPRFTAKRDRAARRASRTPVSRRAATTNDDEEPAAAPTRTPVGREETLERARAAREARRARGPATSRLDPSGGVGTARGTLIGGDAGDEEGGPEGDTAEPPIEDEEPAE